MSDDFFANLEPFTSFAEVVRPAHFVEVPSSWVVVITDVEGSTKAIEAGRYKDVNALGVASIAAARNAVPALELPYVFGGDGATLVVPKSAVDPVARALADVRRIGRERFSLALRIGFVPVADVVAQGGKVEVARYRTPGGYALAMFSGGGLAIAERLVKDTATAARYAYGEDATSAQATLEGFECRWNPIPSRRGTIVSVLVVSRRGSEVHERVLEHLGHLEATRTLSPVAEETLSLARDRSAFRAEASLRGGAPGSFKHALYVRKAAALTALGRYLLESGRRAADFDGATYASEVVANTDFRKFDDCLRMVLDLSVEEARAFEAFLEAERGAGALYYGVHRAEAALMTCLVKSHQGDHVHFVDGSDGGYAIAAKQLKGQMGS